MELGDIAIYCESNPFNGETGISPLYQKHVFVTVIMGNSSNKEFNTLNCVVGFFLESKCMPEVIIELLVHMSVSLSTQTTHNMVNSLIWSAKKCNQGFPPSMFIYNNFDLDFKVAQPTGRKSGTHVSMTSATFALYTETRPKDMCFTKGLHATSPFNKDLVPGDPRIYTPRVCNILPACTTHSGLYSLSVAFVWHLRAILLQQEPLFDCYQLQLGLPTPLEVLPLMRTVQFPASTINTDESQHDGNWQVLISMLDQSGVCDERLEENLILVHGDLATKERLDGLKWIIP